MQLVQRAVLALFINLGLLSVVCGQYTLRATISQRYPLVSACNRITVVLRAEGDGAVCAGSTFTISGLVGTQTQDNQALLVNSTLDGTFATSGRWTRDSGTLVVTVETEFQSGVDRSFFFEVKNPATESQAAVSTSISATICQSDIGPAEMGMQGARQLNVVGGSDPLVTETPEFLEATMRQSNPLAGASNALDFTVKVNTFLPDMSRLQIRDADCMEPLEFDDSAFWVECPCITTSTSTTPAPTTSSSTTTTPAPTSSSSTTTTLAPTTSSTTTLAPTTSSTTTTPVPTSSSTTTTPVPATSSSTTSLAPTTSSSTTSVATTTSSSTTTAAPTSSSTSTTAAGSTSSTTAAASTSSTTAASTSTTAAASTSSTTAASTSTTTAASTSTTTAASTSTTTAALTSSTTAASTSTTTAAATSSSTSVAATTSSTTTPAPTSSSSTTAAATSSTTTSLAPTSSSSTTTSLAPTSSSSTTTSLAPTSSSSTTTSLAPTTSSSTTTSLAPTTSSSTTSVAPTSSSSSTTAAPTSSSTTTSLAPTTSSTTAGSTSSTTAGNTTTAGSTSTTTAASTTVGNTTTAASTSTTAAASTSSTTAAATTTSTTTAAATSSTSTTTPAPTSSSSSTTTSLAPTTTSSTTTTAGPTSSSSTTTSLAPSTSSSTTTAAPTTSSSTTTSVAPTTTSSTTTTSVAPTTTTATTTTTTSAAPTSSTSTTSTTPTPTTSSSTTTTLAPTTSSSTTTSMEPTTSTPIWTSPAPEFPCYPCGYTPIVVHTSPPYALFHGGFYSKQFRSFMFYNAHELDTTSWLGPLRGRINVRNDPTCNRQTSPLLSISGNVDTSDDGEHGGTCSTPIARFPITTPGTPALGVARAADPFRVFPATFSTFEVRQGNPYFDNGTPQVEFVFVANANVAPGSVIVVNGLTQVESAASSISITSTASNFGSNAVWDAGSSTITFSVQKQLAANTRQVVTVSSFSRKTLTPIPRSYSNRVTASGSVEAGDFDAEFTANTQGITLDLARPTAVRSVMAVHDAFGVITLSWTIPESTGPSNIADELTGYLLIARESGVQIARESGSQWALTAQLFNGSDAVNSDSDFLMTPGRVVEVSVQARNTFSAQAGPAGTRQLTIGQIACDNSCGDGRRTDSESCDDGNTASGDGCSSMCRVEDGYVCWAGRAEFECATAQSATSGTATCAQPEFLSVSVQETTDLQGTNNEITVAFRANFPIQANKALNFAGFTGSTTSATSLNIDTQNSPFLSNAAFTQSTGLVTVTTTQELEADTPHSFSFTLTNPTSTQDAVSVTASCSGCSSNAGLAVGTAVSSSTVLGVTVITPACADATKFGASCSETCEGIVKGDRCWCPPGQFGHTCKQRATKSAANTVEPTVVARGKRVNLKSSTGAGVSIPENALTVDAVISATSYDILVEMAADQTDLTPMSIVMDMKPDLAFNQSVELALPVDLTQVAAEQSRGRTVGMAFFNTTRGRWQVQGGYVDRVTGHCKAFSNHFSLWTTMSVVPPAAVPDTTAPPVVVQPGGGAAPTTTTTPAPDDGDDGTWGLGLSEAEFIAAVVGFSVLAALVLCALCACCYLLCRAPKPEPARQPLIAQARPPPSNAVLVEVAPGMEHWVSPSNLPLTAQAYPNLEFAEERYASPSPQRIARPYNIPLYVEPSTQLQSPPASGMMMADPRMSAPPMQPPQFGHFQAPPGRRASEEGLYMFDNVDNSAYMMGGAQPMPLPAQPMPPMAPGLGSAEPMMQPNYGRPGQGMYPYGA